MNLPANFSKQPAALPRASLLRHLEVSSDQRKAMKEGERLRAGEVLRHISGRTRSNRKVLPKTLLLPTETR